MKDKYTYDLIESIGNIDELDLDFNEFLNEDNMDIKIDQYDIKCIREKTHKKIGKAGLKRYSVNSITRLVASILIALAIGTPVALAIVNHVYKYDSTSGSIIKSDDEIYIQKNQITKNINDGDITLTRFVVNPQDGKIDIIEVANNITGFEYSKSDIIVNGENISNDTYTKMGSNSWEGSIGTWHEYNEGDEFIYVKTFKDEEGNETTVEFLIDLVEATSVEQYNKELPKDTKNNITISAITKEEEEELYVELMAIPSVENFEFTMNHYGNHINDLKGSGIHLIDSKGNKVEGEYIVEGNKYNAFKFDTNNLQKPYRIEINHISISNEVEEYKDVSLPKLKFGEKIELNKDINLEIDENLLTSQNNTLRIKNIERKAVGGLDTYILYIDFPDNKISDFELKNLKLNPKTSIWPLGEFNFPGSSYRVNEDGKINKIYLDLQEVGDEDYNKKNKSRGVKFEVAPYEYIVNGNWQITIE